MSHIVVADVPAAPGAGRLRARPNLRDPIRVLQALPPLDMEVTRTYRAGTSSSDPARQRRLSPQARTPDDLVRGYPTRNSVLGSRKTTCRLSSGTPSISAS